MATQKCPECDGRGNDGYHKEEGCLSCHGTGKAKVSESTLTKSKKK